MPISMNTLVGPAVVREQSGGPTMRAIVLDGFGGLNVLTHAEIPKPLPVIGEVVIRVKGFGINHAEMHMRRGEWAEAAEVSGIECVGVVDACPGGEFPIGAKVAALMGGLGRTVNGSYAEFTRVRAENVALVESDLPWGQLATLPETYATAWTCLFRNLKVSAGQTVVIRGGDIIIRPGGGEIGCGRGCAGDRDDAQPEPLRDADGSRRRTRRTGGSRSGCSYRRDQTGRWCSRFGRQ